MKMKIGRTLFIPRFEHGLALIFLVAIYSTRLNAQAISATDGTTNCSVCAPIGWSIANGTPDISDRNFAASAGTSNGGTSWTAAPLPLPPNNHTNWISLRDLGPSGVEEIVETTITGLIIGESYQLTIYTLTATAPYSPEFNNSFRYQIGSSGLQTINGITQNTWGTETIAFVASAGTETIQFLPGNDSGGSGAFESVQISITEDAIVAIADSDGDGVPDSSDVCDGFNDNEDNDSDGIPDGCDDDDDNDGITDFIELQPFFGSLNYEYYDGVPSGQTVANIPTSGALSEGLETDLDIAQLSTDIAGNTTTFGIRYTGRIYLSTSTDYTFYLTSDDGSTLSIDGNEVVNNDGNHACETVNQTVSLNEGFHTIEILYYQDQGGTCLALEYETSAITRQNVPFSILLPNITNTDTDNDGSQDSFDNDSDQDGCFDALEGDGGFTYSDIDTNGRLTTTIDGNGVPGGTTQNDVSSKDDTQESSICTDDEDGDGIDNKQEFENGTDFSDPCDPAQTSSYQGFDTNNAIWQAADCDNDGQSNIDEINDGDATTNPYCNGTLDTGGGSYLEDQGVTNGSNSDGEPDGTFTNNISGSDTLTLTFPSLEAGSEICITVGFNNENGVVNFDLNGTTNNFSNPNGNSTYAAQVICIPVGTTGTQTLIISETGSGNIQVDGSTYYQCNFVDGDDDGDGVLNSVDTAPNDPCIPVQTSGYVGFDGSNAIWQSGDCDGDGVLNGDEFENGTDPYAVSADTDGDGIDDDNEIENTTDINDPCDPVQSAGYTGFDSANATWQAADCDNDGVLNGDEFENGTDPYAISADSDGDGIDDDNEIENGTDENDPCDPAQVAGYSGFDSANLVWRAADCDNDGVLNGDEFDNGTDSYAQSVDTDGDGVDDDNEIANGTDENDPCDPAQTSGYTGFDENNAVWQGGDCDNDGVLNGDEFENGTNPYSASADTDGDGIDDDNEVENGTDVNDPCDPNQPEGYTGFDSANSIWRAADCDGDGVLNGAEFNNGTDPYAVSDDTDGDGINDDNEIENGSDANDPCSPFQNPGYLGFDSNNAIWSAADCDDDGVTNGDEFTNGTDPYEQSVDTDGDGIDDDNEIANNTDRIDPCDPQQSSGYSQFVGSNSIWRAADCDNDGILNGSEFDNGTDPYSASDDTDGDGIDDETEIANGTDEINPCDPVQNSSYTGFDGNNTIWRGADCDGDGVSNGDEFDNGTNPYATSNDTDGDGINDDNEIENGSSPTDACDPAQQPGYSGFDLNNPIWQADDCDNDGISNGDEIGNGTDPYANPGDTDGDGILDDSELAAGSDINDPCSPSQPSNYEGFNPNNPIWRAADCDGDGVLNGNEFDNGTNPYAFSTDTDGDGINDDNEINDGTDINDPCSPSQNPGYSNFNDQNSIWANADCDGDGVSNGDEFNNGTDPYQGGIDTDGDGILDDVELANGSLPDDPCSPTQSTDYTGFDGSNTIWRDADCDNDGALNGTEFDNGTNPYDNSGDNDGDGVSNDFEIASGFDPNDPCDPEQKVNYDGFNPSNSVWAGADCDGDGFLNGEEVDRGTNPYLFTQDSDGDGLFDETEVLQGSDGNNPCDPVQEPGYNGFNEENTVWLAADCDGDGVSNGEEFNIGTDPYTFDETLDPEGDADGDGVSNGQELEDGTDPNDSCDSIGGTPSAEDDCDNDGLTNGEEFTGIDDPSTPANPNGITTDPLNEDSDGDGITDGQEALDQTNPNDACDSNGGTPPANVDCSLVSIASDLVSPQTNGRFTIQNIERFPNNKVTIYNRWGVKVYEATNYDNANVVFNGISTAGATLQKSEELPAGVYFYIISYDRNGESLTLNGYLYLNR